MSATLVSKALHLADLLVDRNVHIVLVPLTWVNWTMHSSGELSKFRLAA